MLRRVFLAQFSQTWIHKCLVGYTIVELYLFYLFTIYLSMYIYIYMIGLGLWVWSELEGSKHEQIPE